MKTTICIFPFDAFGGAGTSAGALLLGDALDEMLTDAHEETTAARSHGWRESVEIHEESFPDIDSLGRWRTTADAILKEVLGRGEFPIWVSGNHLGVLPVYEALGGDTLILQIDAHLDIQNWSDSETALSHGNFIRHSNGRAAIVNLGHRDLMATPKEVSRYFAAAHGAESVRFDRPAVMASVAAAIAGAKRVWLDIDCDGLDPTCFPAVQHPEPFGLDPSILMELVRMIPAEKRAGVSISEFDPGRDSSDRCVRLLVWFVEWLLTVRHPYEEPAGGTKAKKTRSSVPVPRPTRLPKGGE